MSTTPKTEKDQHKDPVCNMTVKPVIKNTRITVEHILRKLSGGMTVEGIIKNHPHLTREDIYSAQAFAADYLADELIAFG